MNFQSFIDTVNSSIVFKNFIRNNPKAKLYAGFFVFDFQTNINTLSLDYFLGDKIYSFSLQGEDVIIKEDKLLEEKTLTPIEIKNNNVECDEIEEISRQEAKVHNIKSNLHKIIAILQKKDNMQVWNLTCLFSDLSMMNIIIDSKTKEVISSDKKGLFDMIRKS